MKQILLSAVKPIKKISVSTWADSYRQLPSDAAEPGRWKTSRAPYTREIMDAFTAPNVHRVVVKSSAQVGKTEILLNIIGRYAHIDPCTILLVNPTLEMSQDFSKARLSRMIQDTKVLTPLFGQMKSRDANQTILSKFFVGGRIVLCGANSPAGLASRPVRIVLCDEVDRFPLSAGGSQGGEGDPVDLAAKRTSNFWNYKIGLFSTPTAEGASRVDIEYNLGTQEEWRHECPNCKEFFALDYRQMQVDYVERKNEAGNRIVVVNEVKWRCPWCGFEFGEVEMKNAPQKYVAQNPDALKNGIRSFWLNGFSSPWLTWKDIMREWLEARGNAARENVVYNTRFGLSYRQAGYYDDENVFLERRVDYDGELPREVLLLTAGVDVQANRLEYVIYGWGAGDKCFGILRGLVRGEPTKLSTWQQLDDVLNREYYFSDGTPMKVARTFIDSGYATASVYEYCRLAMPRGCFPIKGKGGMGLPLLYQYTNPKGSGILLTMLGVDDGKQEVMSRLGITDGEGQIIYPRDDEYLQRGFDQIFFKQLISEHKVMRKSGGIVYQSWEPVAEKTRNEALDVTVYALAAMKSCIGNGDAKEFWRRRYESLRRPTTIKKSPNVSEKKHTVVQREIDLWG